MCSKWNYHIKNFIIDYEWLKISYIKWRHIAKQIAVLLWKIKFFRRKIHLLSRKTLQGWDIKGKEHFLELFFCVKNRRKFNFIRENNVNENLCKIIRRLSWRKPYCSEWWNWYLVGWTRLMMDSNDDIPAEDVCWRNRLKYNLGEKA